MSTTIGISKETGKLGSIYWRHTFLHDSNALLKLQEVEETLIIIVLNNGGGTIFKMLPINEHNNEFCDYFETPHNVSILHFVEHIKLTMF